MKIPQKLEEILADELETVAISMEQIIRLAYEMGYVKGVKSKKIK